MNNIDDRRAYERARKAAYAARYPDRYAAQVRRNSAKARENLARFLCVRAKARAAEKGIPFEITPADLTVPAICPVLGIEMTFGGDRETSPTIDRVIPALGYVPGNVRVISYRANRIKTDATLAELLALVAYIQNH